MSMESLVLPFFNFLPKLLKVLKRFFAPQFPTCIFRLYYTGTG